MTSLPAIIDIDTGFGEPMSAARTIQGNNAWNFASDRDARPALTGPDASNGVSEYGVDMTGSWEREVAAAAQTAPA